MSANNYINPACELAVGRLPEELLAYLEAAGGCYRGILDSIEDQDTVKLALLSEAFMVRHGVRVLN